MSGTRDYYEMLGLDPKELKGRTDDQIERDITSQYRRMALKLHPDKNLGREKEATAEFQALKEAYDALIDRRRRQAYDEMLKQQTPVTFFGRGVAPAPQPNQRVFQALQDLQVIKAEFDKFVLGELLGASKGKNPEEVLKEAKEKGYSSEIMTDPKTGQQMLKVTFPNKESADAFIKQMLEKGMIKPFDHDHDHDKKEELGYESPSPFKKQGKTPRLTKE